MDVTEAHVPRDLIVSRGLIQRAQFVKFTLLYPEGSHNIVFINFAHHADARRRSPRKFLAADDIRKDITKRLDKSYPRKYKVAGILYLYPISSGRAPSRTHLEIFEEGFGDWKVLLATTWWHLIDPAKGSRQEEELRTRHWRSMIERGSDVIRLDYTVASALQAADRLLEDRNVFWNGDKPDSDPSHS